jgi:hypothetical protein
MVHLVHEPRPKAVFTKTVAGKLKVTKGKKKGGTDCVHVRPYVHAKSLVFFTVPLNTNNRTPTTQLLIAQVHI